jgi:tetratricopeptide (TPR) repeat protein
MRRALDVADSLLARAESVDEGWLEPIVLRGWVAHDRARSRATTAGQIQWYERAVAHADRALRRDPQHAAALELRGRMRYRLRELSDAAEAERLLELATADLRAAVAVDSSRALAWITLSDLMRQTGRFVEADRAAKRALKADAFLREAEFVVYQLYQTQLELEDLAAADDWCAEARRRFPETYWPWSCGIFLMALPGGPSPDLEKLSAYFESFERAVPSARRDLFRPLVRMHLAAVLARAGRTDSARAVMSAARGEAEAAEPPDPLRRVLYQEAYVRLLLGEPDSALVLLGQYLELNPQRRGYIAEDWLWRSLRNEPRFEALVRTGG